jgi:hypothetical protein
MAEVAIALAGFSAVAVVLGQRGDGRLSATDVGRVTVLLRTSFAVVVLAFLPMLLIAAPMEPATAWAASGYAHIAWVVGSITYSLRTGIGFNAPRSMRAALPLTFISLTVQVINVGWVRDAWPYMLAIMAGMTIGIMQFVGLMANLWREKEEGT